MIEEKAMVEEINKYFRKVGADYCGQSVDVTCETQYKILILNNFKETKYCEDCSVLLGIAEFGKKNYDEAINIFLKTPNRGDAMANVAECYLKKGDTLKAEKYFLMSVERKYNNSLRNLGLLYTSLRRYQEAIECFNKFGIIEDGYVLDMVGFCYEQLGKLDMAIEYYLGAIQKKHMISYYNIAMVYAAKNDFKEAVDYWIIAAENDNKESCHELFQYYYNKGYYDQALLYALKAFEIDNSSISTIQVGLGYAALGLENDIKMNNYNKKALEYYNLAVQQGSVDAYYNIGCIYARMGDDNEALKYYLLHRDKGGIESLPVIAEYYQNKRLCVIKKLLFAIIFIVILYCFII